MIRASADTSSQIQSGSLVASTRMRDVDSNPISNVDPSGLQTDVLDPPRGRRSLGLPNFIGEAQRRAARQLRDIFGSEPGCCPDCGTPPPPRIDRVPPSRPDYPCPGDHWVYFEYHQAPYPDCTCRLVRRSGGCVPQGGHPPGWTGGRPPRDPPVRPDRDFLEALADSYAKTSSHKDIILGQGAVAQKGNEVLIDVDGYLPRGDKVLSESALRFVLGARRVIAGLEFGVEGMHVGGEREINVPQISLMATKVR